MRRDVQEIFKSTPHEKQVMMFSATLSKDIRPVCKKFMQDVSIQQSIKSNQTSNHNHQCNHHYNWFCRQSIVNSFGRLIQVV